MSDDCGGGHVVVVVVVDGDEGSACEIRGELFRGRFAVHGTLAEKNSGLHIARCLIINITTRHNPQVGL